MKAWITLCKNLQQTRLISETAAEKFYHFAKETGFRFDQQHYPPASQKKPYRNAHAQAAQQLMEEGIAPTHAIAREIIALLTEAKGLDKRSSATEQIRSAIPEYQRAA